MKIVFPLLVPLLALGALALAAPSARPDNLIKTPAPLPDSDKAPVQAASALIVQVIDAQSGKPIAGALVKISALGPADPMWMGRTDAQGKFRVRGLDRSSYWIHAEAGSLLVDQFVRVKAGQKQYVTLTLAQS